MSLTAYLLSLKSAEEAVPPNAPVSLPGQATPASSPGQAAPASLPGQAKFEQNCGGCHPGGNAGVGPALRGPRSPADDTIARTVRNGREEMPAFPPDRLSDQDLADIIGYIHSLK